MHKCTYCTFCCVDFRFQKTMENLLKSIGVEYGNFDRVTIPGGAGDTILTLQYISLSVSLHKSEVYILTAHEDCGAGKTLADLKTTTAKVKEMFPDKEIKSYFLKLDGTWDEFE